MVISALLLILAGHQYGPSQTVQALYDSIARLDSVAAMACILGGDEQRQIWPRIELKNPWSFVLANLSETIAGDRAKVRVTVINETSSQSKPEIDHDMVSLLRLNGEWKIVPYRQTARTFQHITNAMAHGFLQKNYITMAPVPPVLPVERRPRSTRSIERHRRAWITAGLTTICCHPAPTPWEMPGRT